MTARSPVDSEPIRIHRPYLMISQIPHFLHPDGSLWLDRLWHHDLLEHLSYLRRFTLACPRMPWTPQGDLVRIQVPAESGFQIVPLPPMTSLAGTLRSLPRITRVVWKEIGKAQIVHSGIAGWPISLGWVANSIALMRRRNLLLVVESAFWRLSAGSTPNWKSRLRESVTEGLGRFFVNRAQLLLFTQPSYQKSLMTRGRGQAHITPATWIAESDILSDEEADRSWMEKDLGAKEEVRLLYAGRLVPEKGIDVLLQALRMSDRPSAPALRVDVIGEGPRQDACRELSRSLKFLKMDLLPPVPYGRPFFDLVRRYHAMIVPSLSDEQPRIIFDSFSQAVPVLASRTDGLAPYVLEGETGRLFPPGSVDALAALLREATVNVPVLRHQGMRGLEIARSLTHRGMHRARSRILADRFGSGLPA